MLKRSLWLMAVLLLGVLPAQAQDTWFAYLYNWQSHEIVRVDASGSSPALSLGLNENTFFSSHDMTFSADGRRVAFCAVDYSSDTPRATLYLRDLGSNTDVWQRDFGAVLGCKVTPSSFNAEETQLAVSLINHFGPGDPNLDASKPLWQLLILDATSGATLHELNADNPLVTTVDMLPDMPMLPDVRRFTGSDVIFAEVPYGVGGLPTVTAFNWQISSGGLAIVPDGPWGHFGTDHLPQTGESAWVAHNPNLPAADPVGALGFANVVVMGDASGQERIIYHTDEWTVIDVRFIDDGQRLAVLLFPTLNPDQLTGDEATVWVVVDRAGGVSTLQSNTGFGGDLEAAPGGYLYLRTGSVADSPELTRFTLELHTGGQQRELWSIDGEAWEILWSLPTPAAAGLTPFPAVR